MQTAVLALAKNDHALKFEPEVVRPKPDRPDRLLTHMINDSKKIQSVSILAGVTRTNAGELIPAV